MQLIIDCGAHRRTGCSFESRVNGDAEIDGRRGCVAEDILNMVKKSIVGADEAAVAGIVNIEVGMAVSGRVCGGTAGIGRGGIVEGIVARRAGGSTDPIGERTGHSGGIGGTGTLVRDPDCSVQVGVGGGAVFDPADLRSIERNHRGQRRGAASDGVRKEKRGTRAGAKSGASAGGVEVRQADQVGLAGHADRCRRVNRIYGEVADNRRRGAKIAATGLCVVIGVD